MNDKGHFLTHADALEKALELDIAEWFTPTAENYFGKITKPNILAALRHARGTVAPS